MLSNLPISQTPDRSRWEGWLLWGFFLALGAYQLPFLPRYWIAHDEGSVALAADLLLRGAVLYKDIFPVYNGGLDFWHALVFGIFGTNLIHLRWALFLTATVAIGGVLWTLPKKAHLPEKLLLLAALFFWGPVNFPTPMPSWYNLYLALGVYGLLILPAAKTAKWPWILAGILAGLSVTMKLTGLYLVMAVAYSVVYQDQRAPRDAQGKAWMTSISVTLGLLLVPLMVLKMFLSVPSSSGYFFYALPVFACSFFLIVQEWSRPSSPFGQRWMGLLRRALPFAAGFCIPLATLLGYLAWNGVAGAFYQHQFVQTLGRVFSVVYPPPSWKFALGAGALPITIGLSILLVPRLRASKWFGLTLGATLSAYLLFWIVWMPDRTMASQSLWVFCRALPPVAVIAALLVISLRSEKRDKQNERLFFLAACTASVGLIQFPFSHPIYYLYAAPFGCLLLFQLGVGSVGVSRAAGFLLLGVIASVPPLFLHTRNPAVFERQVRDYHTLDLQLERGNGLFVPILEALIYEDLVAKIKIHSPSPELPILAMKDCPEVYFLSGRRPVIPHTWGLPFKEGEQEAWIDETLAVLDQEGVRLIVLNVKAQFPPAIPRSVFEAFAESFPNRVETIGGKFVILWREG